MPTFEEIFEVDHSATTEAAQHVVLNLKPGDGSAVGAAGGHSNNLMTFSSQLSPSQLSENNRNSQIESPASSNKYMYDDIFGQPRVPTSTTASYEELRKQKLLELAKQELLKKQRLASQRIKSQQKQEKFLKLNNYLQQQKKKTLEKSPRSQQLDNFFSKIKSFSSSKTSQFKPDFIKKYQAVAPSGLIKKSDQEEQFHGGWKKKKKAGSGFSKFNGQQYLDKSMETKILDSSLAGSGSLAQIASEKTPAQSSRHDVVTTGEDIGAFKPLKSETFLAGTPSTPPPPTTITTTTTTPKPVRRVWLDVDERENETENLVSSSSAGGRKEPTQFTAEVCERLRVPCRFVTEHPCCSLPQDIDMMGR